MKKTFYRFLSIGTITLLGTVNSIAQCVNTNGEFETYAGAVTTAPLATANAWINDDVDNWYVSHGSPEAMTSPTVNFEMWSESGFGEGMYTEYDFVNGETYVLCYDILKDAASSAESTFRVELTDDLTPHYATNVLVPTTLGNQDVSVLDWTDSGTWITITQEFTVDAGGDFTQLWFYPLMKGLATEEEPRAYCQIDNVCIKEVKPKDCVNLNGEFETYAGTITTAPLATANAWINDDVDNWYVSHGSPEAMTSPTVNFEMWSEFGFGEGMYTEYDFVNGETYVLCYDILKDAASSAASTFRVELTDGLTPHYATNVVVPGTSGNQDVSVLDWTDSGTWITVMQEFTVDAGGDFTQLWFYPLMKGLATEEAPRAYCQIDNVCIKEVKPKDCVNLNGEFETYSGTITTTPATAGNTWINNDVDNWYVSHGSPEAMTSPTVNFEMWSHNGFGEGLYTEYGFVNGETYILTYDILKDATSSAASTFRVELTDDLTPHYATTVVVPGTSGNQDVSVLDWADSGSWITITQEFTVDAGGDFTQLWFYPLLNELATKEAPRANCQIDNICIEHVVRPTDCVNLNGEFETYTDTITTAPLVAANAWINDDVNDWYVSHGSPEAEISPSVNFEMWSQFNHGEGLYTAYGFVNGETYMLTYDILKDPASNAASTFRVELTDDLTPHYATNVVLPTTSGNQDVSVLDWTDSGTWITITQEFTVDAGGDYTQLWFYPLLRDIATLKAPRANCQIDNVCIERVGEVKGRQQQGQTDAADNLEPVSSLSAYPNPSNGNINLELSNGESITQISVYGLTGNLVYQMNDFDANALLSVDLSFLDKGLYTVVVNEENTFTRIVID